MFPSRTGAAVLQSLALLGAVKYCTVSTKAGLFGRLK